MSLYEGLLFLHIALAIIWVGGGTYIQILASRAVRATDGSYMAKLMQETEHIGNRLFIPSSLLLVLLGFWLVAEGDWDYDAWVIIGIAGFLFSFLVGSLFLGPRSGKVGELIAERGPDDPDVRAGARALLLVSRVELVVLFFVVWAMAVKPGA